jgi:hypothetical protein
MADMLFGQPDPSHSYELQMGSFGMDRVLFFNRNRSPT